MVVIGTVLITQALYFGTGLTIGIVGTELKNGYVNKAMITENKELRTEKSKLVGYQTKDGGYVHLKGSKKDIDHLMMKDKFGDKYMVGGKDNAWF